MGISKAFFSEVKIKPTRKSVLLKLFDQKQENYGIPYSPPLKNTNIVLN